MHLPLNALRAFEASARHLNLTRAAQELHVTQTAVSQHIRKLEDRLGKPLFRRLPRGLALTDEGQALLPVVTESFSNLARALEKLGDTRPREVLTVGAVGTFAVGWLLPRLPAFLAQHKGCSLHLQVYPTQIYMAEIPFDVAVQYDDAAWPGVVPAPLMPEVCVAVCAPQSRHRRATERGDFRAVPLLQLSSRLGAWDDWLARAGITRIPGHTLGGHRFDLFSMLVEAVRADLGLGLVPRYFVERELQSGELVLAHPHHDSGARGYSLFVAPGRLEDRAVAAFAQWLRTTVAAEGAVAEMPSDAA